MIKQDKILNLFIFLISSFDYGRRRIPVQHVAVMSACRHFNGMTNRTIFAGPDGTGQALVL
jgi:hypothetical protein